VHKFKIQLLVTFLAISLLGFSSFKSGDQKSEELEWYTKMEVAQQKSAESGKPIFAFFTGSDWCGWCHKLQADVFAKPEFKKWAAENVILLELDFPRRKKLSPELASQNNELRQVFRVTGYPTCWVFKLQFNEETQQMSIMPYGSLGYPSGAIKGKEEVKFLDTANKILANTPKG